MGVDVDRYFGYIMDVEKEYKKAKANSEDEDEDEIWEKYIEGDILFPELEALDFIPYYSRKKQTEGSIILLYDGIAQQYAKLILVKTVEADSYNYDEPDEAVNATLKMTPVPEEIKEKLIRVYKIIFGNSEKVPEVYLTQFLHYH